MRNIMLFIETKQNTSTHPGQIHARIYREFGPGSLTIWTVGREKDLRLVDSRIANMARQHIADHGIDWSAQTIYIIERDKANRTRADLNC